MGKGKNILRLACYSANISMSAVAALSPLLFLTFRDLYGISYSMLGSLVLINFCTQLFIDLVFSFFSQKFNIKMTVRLTPLLTVAGLLIYAASPLLFPDSVFIGLVIGTVIFAFSGGLAEVLISPVMAAVPSENPEREMSRLHSVYAWGVVGVVTVSTLFLYFFGRENWQYLVLLWISVPLISFILFLASDVPALTTPEKPSNVLALFRKKDFILCFLCIFFGGASECTMSQWSSGYLEKALGIPKVWGDVLGVAMFAFMLGLGRTLYAKRGKNIYSVLFISSCGAAACYIAASLSGLAVVGLVSCALTGLCVSMLWPGSLVIAADRFPRSGVAVFALMAAGGDFGGAVGPQLVGTVTDAIIESESLSAFASTLGMTSEQLGMKAGLLTATVFPLLAAAVVFIMKRRAGARKAC